jgi:hypothetical protein
VKPTKLRCLIEGLQLIESVGESEVAADHEVLYAGCPATMTDEQKATMKELGWRDAPEYDSWMIFV